MEDKTNDEATPIEEEDDPPFGVGDLLLGLLLHMAPASIRKRAIEILKEQVSIKAGEEAEEIVQEVIQDYANGEAFLQAAKTDIEPEIQGPAKEMTEEMKKRSEIENLLAGLLGMHIPLEDVTILAVPVGGAEPTARRARPRDFSPTAFAEVTPNCDCPRCSFIKDQESKGLRVRNNGTIVAVDKLN